MDLILNYSLFVHLCLPEEMQGVICIVIKYLLVGYTSHTAHLVHDAERQSSNRRRGKPTNVE